MSARGTPRCVPAQPQVVSPYPSSADDPNAERGAGDHEAAARSRFARWAAFLLAATIGAILFGAVVRITGSGAGCGQHWPTCQGEIAHLPRTVEAAIELTHRVTSGLAGLAAFVLAWPAFRLFPRGHAVRAAVTVACAFMVVEGLIGAALVRFALVGSNASVGRALLVPLHLVSTSALTAAVALAAWWSRFGVTPALPADRVGRWLVVAGMAGVLVVSALGAVTALGDTLYPVLAPLSDGVANDQRDAAHFLERLRIVHPVVAVVAGVYLFGALPRLRNGNRSQARDRSAALAVALTALQLALGVSNVLLGAPGWLQVLHLLVACLLWISLVILGSELGVFSHAARR